MRLQMERSPFRGGPARSRASPAPGAWREGDAWPPSRPVYRRAGWELKARDAPRMTFRKSFAIFRIGAIFRDETFAVPNSATHSGSRFDRLDQRFQHAFDRRRQAPLAHGRDAEAALAQLGFVDGARDQREIVAQMLEAREREAAAERDGVRERGECMQRARIIAREDRCELDALARAAFVEQLARGVAAFEQRDRIVAQIGERERRALRERMRRIEQRADARARGVFHAHFRRIAARKREAEIDFARRDPVLDLSGRAGAQHELYVRHGCVMAREHARQERAREALGAADAHDAASERLGGGDFGEHGVAFEQRAARMRGEALAGLREHHAARHALEQRRADVLFELADLAADGRDGDVQRLRGGGERAGARDLDEIAQGDAVQHDELSGDAIDGCVAFSAMLSAKFEIVANF
ncbi:hypothetical protein PT2222_80250 [Paraburkholderia tropica]